MDRREDAYCGLYCGSCPLFIKTKENTVNEYAVEAGLSVEDMACSGCKSQQIAKWCRACNLKQCAKERGYETCMECEDYLCDDLISFRDDKRYPYHIEIEDNLQLLQQEVWKPGYHL